MNTANYDRVSKKCCGGIRGLRLNPRRFSVQRLRTKFLYLFGLFRRWRNSLRKNLQVRRKSSSRKEVGGYVYSSGGVRTMAHSNSFCSEAIADCLEFIKRNSVSIDDERKPMLKQE
ncbi:UNVERIFIED_CONTAM: hypothetical protein Sangu_1189400 [Sesamum angustifolium]|uniref:Uncharacterized protein n=1 Tax=Sesamum angustifolium TaxID=2727405 RepID=A0AAW2NGS2_9LAMI